ncbi:MAG: tetraacyldisaccharide 4'-kinase [Burkholderiaceae bacterium]
MASTSHRWADSLTQAWGRRGTLAWLLWPLSLLYGALVVMRQSLYRLGLLKTLRVSVPVLVVGNVVAGGSGKTPIVQALVRHWQLRGLQVGVVARGYGRTSRDCREVHRTSPASSVGDEPALLKRSTGAAVFVAANRFEAASALLTAHPQTDLIICDDGLQHHGLYRDIEICVFDDRGLGNGWLLPAGPLRESWPRHNSAMLVLHSGAEPVFSGWQAQRQLANYALRSDGSQVVLSTLKQADTPVLFALAAIAQPEVFFGQLRMQGLVLQRTFALPDHADLENCSIPSASSGILLCTEKDAVKLWQFRPDALAVPLLIQLDPSFVAALEGQLPPGLRTKLSSAHEHSH